MMTEKITLGQRKQIVRFFEDGLDALGLTKDEAQQIIQNGDEMQFLMNKTLRGLPLLFDRFELLNSFELIVPNDYSNESQLNSFMQMHKEEFQEGHHLNYYPLSKNKLEQGKPYKVELYVVRKLLTPLGLMVHLKNEGKIFAGVQGGTLVWQLKRKELPVGGRNVSWTVLLDDKNYIGEKPVLPNMYRGTNGLLKMGTRPFAQSLGVGEYFLCYSN